MNAFNGPGGFPKPRMAGYKTISRTDWQTQLTDDGSLPNNSRDAVGYGSLQRIAEAMEGILVQLTRVANLVDPAARREAERREERHQQYQEEKEREDKWFGTFHDRQAAARRLRSVVRAFFEPAGLEPRDRDLLLETREQLAEYIIPVPDDWRSRDPAPGQDIRRGTAWVAFDPETFDWDRFLAWLSSGYGMSSGKINRLRDLLTRRRPAAETPAETPTETPTEGQP